MYMHSLREENTKARTKLIKKKRKKKKKTSVFWAVPGYKGVSHFYCDFSSNDVLSLI